MGGPYVGNAGVFLIQTLFGLYILAVMLRFLLQAVRADFFNPISQFLVMVTDPPLKPLRRVIPAVGGFDLAAVVPMIILQAVELFLVGLVQGFSLGPASWLVLSVGELLSLLINVYFIAIIIQVILSWINPGSYNPAMGLLHAITEPLLGPARRMIPPIGGLDLSPIVVIVALQLVRILVLHPLIDTGQRLAMGG